MVQTKTSRLGGRLPAAASAGFIDSSNGSASETPEARRNVRRSRGRVMCFTCLAVAPRDDRRSLIPEQRALDDFVNDGPDREVGFSRSIQNRLDAIPVGKLDFSACRVDHEL